MTVVLKQRGPSQKYASDFNDNIFKSAPLSSLPSLCLMLYKERNIWIILIAQHGKTLFGRDRLSMNIDTL